MKSIIMKIYKIELLLEKYFEGNTSVSEEKELKDYFLSNEIAPHLLKHKDIFVFYSNSKKEQFSKELRLPAKRIKNTKWRTVAASFVVLCAITTVVYLQLDNPKQEDLGTFDSPEEAFVETHKALQLVATNINSGMKNVSYLEEYENTKKIIFK